MNWIKRLDKTVFGALINALGGYTFEEVKGVEDFYITERDKDRQEKEALQDRLNKIESDLLDIKDRKLIAYSVPDEDWNPTSMKLMLGDMAARLERLTTEAERRRKRASERARSKPRDAMGRFLVER